MWEQLIMAINAGDTIEAIRLISFIDIQELDKSDDEGNTALHLASRKGDEKVCELIIEVRPQTINAFTKDIRSTALHLAANEGYEAICRIILEADPQAVNAMDKYGWTALHKAAWKGYTQVCEAIIEMSYQVINAVDSNCYTALCFAAQNSHEPVCELILKINPQAINVVDKFSNTVLHFAAGKGLKSVCELILKINPQAIKAIDGGGHTVLHEAAIGGHKEVCELFIPKMTRHAINAVTKNGQTALHKAAKNGHKKICELILNTVPEVINVIDNSSCTASQLAAIRGHEEVYELLDNFTGKGLEEYEKNFYWYEYSKEGIGQILALRLQSSYAEGVKVFSPFLWNNSLQATKELSSLIIFDLKDSNYGIILVPINLYSKHWVGLAIDKTAYKINLHYMDPEQQPIPVLLKEKLTEFLINTNPDQQINIIETVLEKQKYNNCGPEVIENFMHHLTSYRLNQEDAVYMHSLLYYDSLTLIGDWLM